jgi:NitT/TauT family transport system permease protein
MEQPPLPPKPLPEPFQATRSAARWLARADAPWTWQIAGVLAALALWQLATQMEVLGPQFGPTFSPASAAKALVELTTSGVIWPHLVASLRRVLVGLAVAASVGIPVGIIISYYRRAQAASQIVFQFLRMISPLAWMPITIIVLGVGDRPIYFLVALAAVWPFIINTAHGLSRVNTLWINVARNLGATEGQILRRIILPAILPDVLTGLRLAIGWAWIMVVPDEMLGVSSGLGYFILDTRDRFRYDQLMAVVLVIGLLGYLLDGLVRLLQRRYGWAPATE